MHFPKRGSRIERARSWFGRISKMTEDRPGSVSCWGSDGTLLFVEGLRRDSFMNEVLK